MKIIESKMIGMCSGVRRAIQMARAVEHPRATAILGELVHNPDIHSEMARRGFQAFSEEHDAALPQAPQVLVTAHGISEARREWLHGAGKTVIDATCPYVRWIHQTARRLADEGYFVIILGKTDHAEVRGIVEDLARCAVVEKREEVRRWPAERIAIICQSTFAPDRVHQLVEALRRKNAPREVRFVPTSCRETLKRQEALREMLQVVDALVVVGGKNSHNTLALARTAAAHGKPCLHVESAGEITEAWALQFACIGIAAGTSTPDEAIAGAHERLLQIADRREVKLLRKTA